MTKIEQIKTTASGSRPLAAPFLHIVDRLSSQRESERAKVVPFSSIRLGPQLVRPANHKRLMGRKGREALARRRALDGAFLTVAMGTVALIWWSTL